MISINEINLQYNLKNNECPRLESVQKQIYTNTDLRDIFSRTNNHVFIIDIITLNIIDNAYTLSTFSTQYLKMYYTNVFLHKFFNTNCKLTFEVVRLICKCSILLIISKIRVNRTHELKTIKNTCLNMSAVIPQLIQILNLKVIR